MRQIKQAPASTLLLGYPPSADDDEDGKDGDGDGEENDATDMDKDYHRRLGLVERQAFILRLGMAVPDMRRGDLGMRRADLAGIRRADRLWRTDRTRQQAECWPQGPS